MVAEFLEELPAVAARDDGDREGVEVGLVVEGQVGEEELFGDREGVKTTLVREGDWLSVRKKMTWHSTVSQLNFFLTQSALENEKL